MKDSLFVVVPLEKTDLPHGHTTIAQAMRLGKAVITTRGASVEDYVIDTVEGLYAEAGDVKSYRKASLELLHDEQKRDLFAARAKEKADRLFTYENYARELSRICEELMR